MINPERLCQTFEQLAGVASPSFHEGAIARLLTGWFEALGATVEQDDASRATGGDAGNLIIRLPANRHGGAALLLSAHMDTVNPAQGVRPLLRDGVFTSAGDTVLGADDKSGIAQIVEVVRCLREGDLAHPPLEIVLSVCEEVGLLGAKHLDCSRLQAREGLVLDTSGVGSVARQAPCANKLRFVVEGIAAHAGLAPEQGLSAIQIAARGLATMPLGRIDADTTANIGLIQGGTATNIVPERVQLLGEARSFNRAALERQTRQMCACLEQAVAQAQRVVQGQVRQARLQCEVLPEYPLMDVAEDAPLLRRLLQAADRLGQPLRVGRSGGGSDANIFNARGIVTLNLASGMEKVHTVEEFVRVTDLVQVAELLLAFVCQPAEADRAD
jgi:tripeptide aminopeptidase